MMRAQLEPTAGFLGPQLDGDRITNYSKMGDGHRFTAHGTGSAVPSRVSLLLIPHTQGWMWRLTPVFSIQNYLLPRANCPCRRTTCVSTAWHHLLLPHFVLPMLLLYIHCTVGFWRKIWTHLDLLSIPQSGGKMSKCFGGIIGCKDKRDPRVLALGQQYHAKDVLCGTVHLLALIKKLRSDVFRPGCHQFATLTAIYTPLCRHLTVGSCLPSWLFFWTPLNLLTIPQTDGG